MHARLWAATGRRRRLHAPARKGVSSSLLKRCRPSPLLPAAPAPVHEATNPREDTAACPPRAPRHCPRRPPSLGARQQRAATLACEAQEPAPAPAGLEAGRRPPCGAEPDGSPLAVVASAAASVSSTATPGTAKMAATAEFVSPFASSLAQHAGGSPPVQPDSPLPQPHSHTSRSGSPVRVVGFDSSPNSVVLPRRWQSAAVPGSVAAMEAAAAMDAALAATDAGGRGPAGCAPQARPSSSSLERKVRFPWVWVGSELGTGAHAGSPPPPSCPPRRYPRRRTGRTLCRRLCPPHAAAASPAAPAPPAELPGHPAAPARGVE